MKALLRELRTSVIATIVLVILACGIYPLLVWIVAQGAFSHEANGSFLTAQGKTVGSRLIAQGFSSEKYFHPRPSAVLYSSDGANSGGTNLGPISEDLINTVAGRIQQYRAENGLAPETPIPADAVTASAGGLDPHISPANAVLQARRVARTRGMTVNSVRKLVDRHTEDRTWGIFGEPRVNVLVLNLALDHAK